MGERRAGFGVGVAPRQRAGREVGSDRAVDAGVPLERVGVAGATRLGEEHRVREQPACLDAAFENGVAASSVSSISSALWIWLPSIGTGCEAGAGQ